MQNSAIAQAPTLNYLASLNPQQRAAVEATEGAVLVLAGAGTGKTKVLTTRIAHLINSKRAFPGQILAVTFTNKAAQEMRERVTHLLFGDEAETKAAGGLWLGTFHSIAAKILRRHAELVGLTPQFTILDDDDQQRLLKALLLEANIDHQKFPTRAVQNVIQGWKDKGFTPDKVTEQPGIYTLAQVAAKLYPLYQNRLKNLNCCDFGDLLLHNLTIFQAHTAVLEQYAHRFRYILVDEYQDTNVGQYLWLRLLAIGHKNLCCVGDDDQSIYGWRGADVGNILKFEVDFPTATIIKLERNYRSTAPILKAASGLIDNNKGRLGKTLWTDEAEGTPVRIKSVWDDNEEARFVGEEIESFQRNGISLKEMAVLVRTGYQTRAFEERFMTLAVPYKVVGGLRFYERMEIRDAIAYLRIIAQPHDDLALERIINTPKRGIGKATMEQLHIAARAGNCSLTTALNDLLARGELKGKTATTLQRLMDQFARWRGLVALRIENQESSEDSATSSVIPSPLRGGLGRGASNFALNLAPPSNLPPQGGEASRGATMSLAQLADLVLEESGYRAMWQADKTPEAVGRLDNLRELIRALGDFPTLADFLEHVGLVMDKQADGATEMVSIMSLHAAKGLEFDSVFLTGWEEGLFPSQRTMDELGTAGLEEERRLAYVGITRARKHLTISHAANRRIYNQWQSSVPSRFLSEIPSEIVEHIDGGSHHSRASGPAMFQREIDGVMNNRVPPPLGGRLGGGLNRAETEQLTPPPQPSSYRGGSFTKGSRIFHQKFGNGVVLNVEGDHLQIAFKHAGVKKILAEFVELAA
jgi:DNA helicase-2/ATP-dependent DNA helicase PcrA